jgi:serine/threonine protein kinase
VSAADRSKESASELGPDFEVIRRLPGGTVAEVFLVRPAAGGAPLVMKVVRKGLTQDQDVVARFLDEVRALQGLAHPYIIRQLGTGRLKDDRLYLLTEALEGEDLQAHLHAQGPVGPDDAVRLLLPLCDALDHVHRRGLVHRDLKPDNVFLAGGLYQFSPRLLDFGLAFFEGQRHAQTVTGLVVGTPEFTAPECVAGQRADARSDLYALGALLYNMLTGSPPFLAPRPDQLFQKVLHDPVPALPPPCAWLDPVVQRLTAKSPEDRYGSAAEVADALRRVARRPGTLPIPLSEPALQLEQVGDVVGNFELTQLLGEGSMGRVFQARHTRLGRQVALKVLRPEHVRTPDLVQRFFQEARTVNQINHEHIVEIIDFVAESGADGVPHAY